ncbi:uncharacterized protein N7458_004124 [Penicillium daleae]|uniref:Kinesin light chain n=1 Tax=Penicillium daleae TaxID=63821 RepID=A0AAD6G542_9EURO|nr:uncharacterized protein N7458_004124 [Penicillium daleae]KAJ5455860.1 hypothetical protein N7458_004124 [Penicillium daleae]
MYQRVLEGREKVFGPEHPNTLNAVTDLGVLLQRKGKYEEAEPMHRRDLEGSEKALGLEHPDTFISVDNLGMLLQRMGNYEEAEPLHRRALEGREKALGFEHPDTLSSVNNLGVLLQDQGKDEEAEAMYRRALEAYQKTLGPEHPDTLACRKNIARSRKLLRWAQHVLTTQSVEDPSDEHPSVEETSTLAPKQNKPSTPAQKFLENHPLFRGSRSAQAVPRRDDLDEVD